MPNLYTQDELKTYEMQLSMLEGALSGGWDKRDALSSLEAHAPGFADFYSRLEQSRREEIKEVPLDTAGVSADERPASWYGGAYSSSGQWPRYRDRISSKLPREAVKSTDETTSWILGSCANPLDSKDRRKGLVVGFVQSGKTANYAGLIAKSVDAGYRIIIVLAGMHSNLREQTQVRLAKDLGLDESDAGASQGVGYLPATSAKADIGPSNPVAALNAKNVVLFMVVKKNPTRLKRVSDFLGKLSDDIRRKRPVMIIDDESDQATPNTMAAKDKVSTINQRVRDIWDEVRVGSYVAYTATPFANIFIDPEDENDLYPEDFAFALPRPQGYMGSASFFSPQGADDGTESAVDDLEPADMLSIEVPEAEADRLAVKKVELDDYQPEVMGTLEEAIRWFAIATAIRRLRSGRSEHSSMLVHMSHYVGAHFAQKDAIQAFCTSTGLDIDSQEEIFRDLHEKQIDKAARLRETNDVYTWDDIWSEIQKTWRVLKVVVDNGSSSDRLNYPENDPQTVIAVGGGTLSRGLTLEGLVVSYFLRTSNTYDTLLQMGRWFGFRPGYQDLTRVWVGPGLLEDFRFLAEVEDDLRAEMDQMMRQGLTPKQLGIRIRNHPGRLQITGRDKMHSVEMVEARLGGQRYQSTYLDISPEGIATAQNAARNAVSAAVSEGTICDDGDGARLIAGVSSKTVLRYLEEAWVPDVYPWIKSSTVKDWLSKQMPDASWNVVLASPRSRGEKVSFDYGHGLEVRTASRSKERRWKASDYRGHALSKSSRVANIRVLLSDGDIVSDLRILHTTGRLSSGQQEQAEKWLEAASRASGPEKLAAQKRARQEAIPGEGLLILYAIDPKSSAQPGSAARADLDADEVPISFGIVFPSLADPRDEGEFLAVLPPSESRFEAAEDDEDDVEAEELDDEGQYEMQDVS